MTMFRIRYRYVGGHVRCRFFAGETAAALANCGVLTMKLGEFIAFQRAAKLQFVEEYDPKWRLEDEDTLEGPQPARDRRCGRSDDRESNRRDSNHD